MHSKKIIIAIVLLVSLVVIALLWLRGDREDRDVTTLHLYGNIDIREAQLTFNSSEHIAEIRVQEGDRVTRGQLLARLDTELLNAQLAEANAALSTQQQVVAKFEAGSRPEEILKGRAELEAARARARAAVDSHQRIARLLKKKLSSPEDVENAKSLADAFVAQAEAAKQALALLEAGPRKEDIAGERGQLLRREAALAVAQQRLEDANLYAPANGVIRNRILEIGDMASPQKPVLTLAFIDPVWVRTYLPEPALGQIALGAKALIHTDSFPDKDYVGWVGFISPTAEFTPKNIETPELRTHLVYSARVYACNPQGELRLGMPVSVTITRNQTLTDDNSNHCGQ